MKEFVEKLISRLQKEKAKGIYDIDNVITVKDAYGKAIKIVNQLAEEYNNGWILCKEKMPELDKWVLGQGVFDVMIVCLTETYKGIQWMDINGDNRAIVAWQPLPQPYKEENTSSTEWKQHILNRFEGGEIR